MSFVDFYQHSYRRLAGQLSAYLGDAAEAEDVLQEAYLRAWQRWDDIGHYDDPSAWVSRVAWNLATSRWRRVSVAARHLRRQAPPEPVAGANPDHVALVDALRDLPDVHRRAVVLHYLGDLPVDEIASELGVPRGTVLSWLHRSRARLADLLREDAIPVRPAPAPERVVAKAKRRRTTRLAAAIAALLTGATAAAAAVPAIVANLPHPVTRIEDVVWTGGTITLPATTDAQAHECPTGRRDIKDGSSTGPLGHGRIEPQSTSPSEWTALWIDGSSAIYGDLTGDGVNEAVLLVDCDNGTDFANPAVLIRRQHLLVITRRGGRLVALGYLGPRFARIIDYRIENGAVRAWFKPSSTMIGDLLGRVDAPKYGASFAWDGRSMRQVAGPTQVGGIPFNPGDHDPTEFAALVVDGVTICPAFADPGPTPVDDPYWRVRRDPHADSAYEIDLNDDGDMEALAYYSCSQRGISDIPSLYVLQRQGDKWVTLDIPLPNAGGFRPEDDLTVSGHSFSVTIRHEDTRRSERITMTWDGTKFQRV